MVGQDQSSHSGGPTLEGQDEHPPSPAVVNAQEPRQRPVLPHTRTFSPSTLHATASPSYRNTIGTGKMDQRVPARSSSESSGNSSSGEEKNIQTFNRFFIDSVTNGPDRRRDHPMDSRSLHIKTEPVDIKNPFPHVVVKREPGILSNAHQGISPVSRINPNTTDQYEAASSRVRRELSADFEYHPESEGMSSLSKLENLVKNIPASSPPDIPHPPLRFSDSPRDSPGKVKIIKPQARRLAVPLSPRSPSACITSPAHLTPITGPLTHLQQLQKLAEQHKITATASPMLPSPLPSMAATPKSATLPSGAWPPVWPPTGNLPNQPASLQHYPGMGPWPMSPHMPLPMFMPGMPGMPVMPVMPGMQGMQGMPTIPGYPYYPSTFPFISSGPLFPGVTMPTTVSSSEKITNKYSKAVEDKSNEYVPLDLSGKRRADSETSASDLASPLSDKSSPGDATRPNSDEPLNLAKKFRYDVREPPAVTTPEQAPRMPAVPQGFGGAGMSALHMPLGLHPGMPHLPPSMGHPTAGFFPPTMMHTQNNSVAGTGGYPTASKTMGISPTSSSSTSPYSDDQDLGSEKKKRKFLNSYAVNVLSEWYSAHHEHPYPNDDTVEALAERARITESQVKKWMANKRVRSCNTLTHNGSIHPKKLQKLIQIKEGVTKAIDTNNTSPPAPKVELVSTPSPVSKAGVVSAQKLPKGNRFLHPMAVETLNTWYEDHLQYPYPTEDQKHELAHTAGITLSQVTCWFANKRNRSNNSKKISTKNMWKQINQKKRVLDSLEHDMERRVFDNKHLAQMTGSIDV